MPKITNNNGDLSKAFFGNAEVEKIYLGNTELYSKAAPVAYVIPAGLYYGKASPALYSETIDGIRLSVDGIDCMDLYINNYKIDTLNVSGRPEGLNLYDSNTWYHRAIEVPTDYTATQSQYNLFFACFDYAFYIMQQGNPPASIVGVSELTTWMDAIANSLLTDSSFTASAIRVKYAGYNIRLNNSYVNHEEYIVHGATYTFVAD